MCNTILSRVRGLKVHVSLVVKLNTKEKRYSLKFLQIAFAKFRDKYVRHVCESLVVPTSRQY